MQILKAEHISVETKDKKILQDISFQIEKGDFLCIIGKNGSGKTTLLKTLAKLITPTNGNIFINGKNIATLSRNEIAKQMSIVFQNSYNDFDFKVWDVVLMGRMAYQKIWQKDSEEDLFLTEKALKDTNTLHLKDKSFHLLSGGEQQRVLIARALCQNTDLMLFDEPISNLDIKHQFEIMDLLQEMNQKLGKTIFLIIHDLNICLQYAQKVLAIDNGKNIMFGSTKEILTKQNILSLFGVEAQIIKDEKSEKDFVLFSSSLQDDDKSV